MSARLSVATVDLKALILKAEAGDRIAALELANIYKCQSVTDLLEVLCPLGNPSVALFDCAADSIRLKERRDANRPPALDLK